MNGRKIDPGGKAHIVYASLRSACRGCPLRAQCLTEKAPRRTVYRWEHHDVIDRHKARMAQAGGVMQKRKALAQPRSSPILRLLRTKHLNLDLFHKKHRTRRCGAAAGADRAGSFNR
jgi:hypothetical protein